MTLIIFYLFLIFNLFSKFLLTDICLPFTFYFTIFPLLFFSELFLLFRITIFLLPMSYSLCPLEPASTAFATIVSEALFRLCRGTNITTLLGCDRISGHVPRLFILYIFSYLFFVDSYIAGARETQEDTL